ncbi:protein shuttle craft [Anthonomus grandis grandis]|uniref:protein shuttle craft n=1 Tax=Anthonomus grandis grandis TaxID=2921223 RepID=UPI0021665FC3|nr:protein shuttle craft [Anthonomus grandis grandis]
MSSYRNNRGGYYYSADNRSANWSSNSAQDIHVHSSRGNSSENYPSQGTSQGAVRRQPYNRPEYGYHQPDRPENCSDLQPDAPEFYPSGGSENTGAVRKRYRDKNTYDNNWRSSKSNFKSQSYNSKPSYKRNNFQNASSSKNQNFNYQETLDESCRDSNSMGDVQCERRYENTHHNNGYRSKYGNYQQNYEFSNNYGRSYSNGYKKHQKKTFPVSTKTNRGYNASNPNSSERKANNSVGKENLLKRNLSTADQRERLTEMIDGNLLECMVCCEKIKRADKVWACTQCYHIIHMKCTVAWAESSKVEDNWRCPACQNIYAEVPSQYLCFCGKVTDPKQDPNIIPHGCDNMCLRKGKNCEHKCSILCHPGPCPECTIMVSKPCGCGATSQMVKCCTDLNLTCDSVCNKLLNCGLHRCVASCHIGPCLPCEEMIIQECFCGKTSRKIQCNEENVGKTHFICDNICNKLLLCGNHKCQKQCHPEECDICETDIDIIKSCYCGKTALKNPRTSCLDPIPCCDNICGKQLICGPPSNPHLCRVKCHAGKCPPCPSTTLIRCRCGHMDKEIACLKLTSKADDQRCDKKCTKKRLCGKHTCKQKCCIEIEHICPLPCNKLLTCGLHRCDLTCHSGRCPPCIETSFEEMFCECGASVLYPPIPCGTKPPLCQKPCSKPRPCGHPPNHECHPGTCPPCYVLTKQWCFGKHEQRSCIPCNQHSFSCGLPCGKPMPCGRHKCVKPCHDDDCPVPCTQPCTTPRMLCGHPCNKPCHNPPCPESNCRQLVPVTCLCGLRKSTKVCLDLTDEFRNIEMSQLKEKMTYLSCNQSIDLTDTTVKKPSVLKILDCNDECKVVERNRRLAIGLQIQNPDLSQKLTPRYSELLKQWAKKDPKFCQRVHDKLTELVQLSKQSKQKSRAFSFESMNRDKRQFIHEYCEYFGVESAAYDAEPNRNVVATAIKDKSWLPSMSLLEVLQRENGQRKVPGPILCNSSSHHSETVSLRLPSSSKRIE